MYTFSANTVIESAKINANFTELQAADTALSAIVGTGGAWASWTPTWTNLTLGSSVQNFKYYRIGRIIFIRGYITLGAGSSVGTNPYFTLPVTMADTHKGTATGLGRIGEVYIEDNTTTNYVGILGANSTTTAQPQVLGVGGTYGVASSITSTAPMTWVSGDEIRIMGVYEGVA